MVPSNHDSGFTNTQILVQLILVLLLSLTFINICNSKMMIVTNSHHLRALKLKTEGTVTKGLKINLKSRDQGYLNEIRINQCEKLL